MQLAIASGQQEVIQILVEAGASLSDSEDAAPTLVTAQNLETIAFLIQNGANSNSKDERGSTFLHHVISYSSSDIIKLVLDSGADIHSKDAKGRTPIYRAAYGMEITKSPRNFELLIEAVADYR